MVKRLEEKNNVVIISTNAFIVTPTMFAWNLTFENKQNGAINYAP
jgi:hypothetical protein